MPKYFIETLHVAVIIRTVLIGISLVLIPYFSVKFYSLRLHFIIQGRYPIITIIASNSFLIVGIMYLILSYLEYTGYMTDKDYIESDKFWLNIILSGGQIFSFIFCALILYRTWLVHIKWSEYNKNCTETEKRISMSNTISSAGHIGLPSKSVTISFSDDSTINDSIRGVKKTKKYCECKTVLSWLIIFGSIVMGICYFFRSNIMSIIAQVIWFGVIISAIIIVFKTWKTKEALNCIRECYVVIFILMSILISVFAINSREWRFCLTTILALFGSYTYVCLPLIFIYRIEKTISPSKIFNDNISTIIDNSPSKMTLTEYLNASESNFTKFKSYLIDCVAVEALLYYSDTIIFRDVLIELLSKVYPNACASDLFNKPYSPIKFQYLIDIREGFKNKIFTDNITQSTIQKIRKVANKLRTKYIDNCSTYEINISHRCRQTLLQFYDEMNNTNTDCDDYSMIIVKYICAYASSLRETLRLLNSVYNFNFKKSDQ